MSADLFTRLERAHAMLKTADMLGGRPYGFGILRNEARQYAEDAANDDNRNGTAQASNPAASKGRWNAFVSRVEAYHDDPSEAVRLVEAECASMSVKHLRDERQHWEKKIADAATALATIETLLPKDPP